VACYDRQRLLQEVSDAARRWNSQSRLRKAARGELEERWLANGPGWVSKSGMLRRSFDHGFGQESDCRHPKFYSSVGVVQQHEVRVGTGDEPLFHRDHFTLSMIVEILSSPVLTALSIRFFPTHAGAGGSRGSLMVLAKPDADRRLTKHECALL